MVKVRVKFFGTLSHEVPGYDPGNGLALEFVDGAKVKDLLRQLKNSEVKGGVVTVDGKVLHPDDPLKEGASVCLLQAMDGG
jgi:sulfur carrier protein ThiS